MIGTSLGPYKIIEQLGAGGMGEVYLGEDTRLGRKVTIKVPLLFRSYSKHEADGTAGQSVLDRLSLLLNYSDADAAAFHRDGRDSSVG